MGESKYSKEDMVRALLAVQEGMSFRQAVAAYQVPKSSLPRRYHGKVRSPHKFGRKTALLRSEEFAIAQNLAALGDFGFAFDSEKLRDFIKEYLDDNLRDIPVFKNNRPDPDWDITEIS